MSGEVYAFGSWKREMCADLGSPVGSPLSHVEPTMGQFLSCRLYGTSRFSLFQARAQQESLWVPSHRLCLEARELAAQGNLPSSSLDLDGAAQGSTDYHVDLPRGRRHEFSTPGNRWELVTFELGL